MKLPILNKYISINIFTYLILTCAISGIFSYGDTIIRISFYLWILFLILFGILQLLVPFSILLLITELIFFKLKILKYKHLEVNVSPKVQKIVYTLAALSFAYYLWYKFYFEPILDKMLEFD